MNTLKNKLFVFLACACLVFVGACSDDDTEKHVIVDSWGVEIKLIWITDTGIATENADLDLFLYNGTTLFSESTLTNGFEQLFLIDGYDADGEYTVEIELSQSSMRADYKVEVTALSNAVTTKSVEQIGHFDVNDSQPTVVVMKIKKAGPKFTITVL